MFCIRSVSSSSKGEAQSRQHNYKKEKCAMHDIGRDTAPESKNTIGKLDKVLNTDD